MKQLEKLFEDAFKNVPPMPNETRKALADAAPWMALAGGILSLIAAWHMFGILSVANGYVSGLYSAFGYPSPFGGYTLMGWVGIVILLAQAVLFFIAYPPLRSHKKAGWDLLFFGALASVVYAVITNILSGPFNIGQLIFSLVGSGVGLYLIFQVRSYFGGAEKPATAAKTDKKS